MLSKITIKSGGVSKGSQKYLIFLTVIALSIFSFSVLRGSLTKIGDIHKKTADQKKTLFGLEKKLAYLQSLDKATLLEQTTFLESVFPSKKPVMSLINSLKAVARENNVSYAGIKLNPGEIEKNTDNEKNQKSQKTSQSKLESFYLDVSLVGTLDNIFAFVDQLNLTAPLVSINSLDINSLDVEEEKESFIKASIGITIFYQAPPLSIGTINTALKEFSNEDEEIFSLLDDYVVYPEVKIFPENKVGKDNFFQNL